MSLFPKKVEYSFKVWDTLVAIYVFESMKRAIRTYNTLCCVELLANSPTFSCDLLTPHWPYLQGWTFMLDLK